MENLTDWKNPPTLADLRGDLDDARSAHDAEVSKISDVLDHMYVRGAAKVKRKEGRSGAQPKLIRKNAEWRYPSLSEPFLSSPNIFDVQPVTWEDRDAARQNSMLLNYQFNNKLNKQLFVDNLVRAAVDEGVAIVKTGWDREVREEEEEQFTYELIPNPMVEEQLVLFLQLRQESPSQYAEVDEGWRLAAEEYEMSMVPCEPRVIASEMVKVEKVVRNQPTLEICDYRNVIIDPTCAGDISKAQFVVHRFESSLSALEADGRYKNLKYITPVAESPVGEPDYAPTSEGTKSFTFRDQPRQKFVVHEYWGFRSIDGSDRVEPIVAAWVGNIMIRLELNPFPGGEIPFVTIPYLPVRNSIYGESDGSLLIENQMTVGAITRGLIDTMAKSANGQTGFAKGALDIPNKKKLEAGDDFEFNPGQDPRATIVQMQFPALPPSAEYMIQSNQQEAESLTGVKAFNNGIGSQALGDTATGIRGALDAASKRELGILRRISDGVIKVGRKIIGMNAVFLDDEEVVRITNEEFVQIRRDDLQGEFDLRLTISTAEEDNAKAQELAFMFQTLGPNVDWGITAMILGDIAELRKMPDLAKRIRDYQPQPDPIAEQKAQLELMLLQAQIATEQAKAASLGAGANLSTVKQGTEMAKAKHLQSAADLADLNFVEQETGVQQERDLEKMWAQADAQTKMKLVDGLLRQQEASQMNKPGAQ